MTEYRSKPAKVEAFRLPKWTPGEVRSTQEYPGWLQGLMGKGLAWHDGEGMLVSTPQGGKRAGPSDWIVMLPGFDVKVMNDAAFTASFDTVVD